PGFGDLPADLAERARDLASFEWRVVGPASGGKAAKFVGGEMQCVNLGVGYRQGFGVIGQAAEDAVVAVGDQQLANCGDGDARRAIKTGRAGWAVAKPAAAIGQSLEIWERSTAD